MAHTAKLMQEIVQSNVDPASEPTDEIQVDDHPLGEIPDLCRKIWSRLYTQDFELQRAEEIFERTPDSEIPVLISQLERIAQECRTLRRIFWLEALAAIEQSCPEVWYYASTKGLFIRKNWILVCREREEDALAEQAEESSEDDANVVQVDYEPETDKDDFPPPPADKKKWN